MQKIGSNVHLSDEQGHWSKWLLGMGQTGKPILYVVLLPFRTGKTQIVEKREREQ